jgi:hypothetical protein
MTLGIDHGGPRRLRRKRTAWFVASGFFIFVFLLFVGGTTHALSAPGYRWEEGELPIEIGVIVVSASLALFTGLRGQRLGRQAADLDEELSVHETPWLPPEKDPAGPGVKAMTPRLGLYSRRAAVLCLAWVAAFLLGVGGFVLMDESAQRLLADGVRTPGTVVDVHNPRKGTPTITVQYRRGGALWEAGISRDSELDYTPGQRVTVIYDPADPGHVRTTEEPNDNALLTFFSGALVVGGGLLIPFAAVAAVRWRRRHRAVRESGWRHGLATVSQPTSQRAEIIVRYRDGTRITLKAAMSTHTPVSGTFYDVRVWVGGEGRDMVVLLPRGRIRNGPHAVPVYADGPRV